MLQVLPQKGMSAIEAVEAQLEALQHNDDPWSAPNSCCCIALVLVSMVPDCHTPAWHRYSTASATCGAATTCCHVSAKCKSVSDIAITYGIHHDLAGATMASRQCTNLAKQLVA